ncbi:MAG: glycosyltransferase family 4 protein [Ignavibacteria bacterium]|nr:glycosyltransferase family 4 protein [Ignavibacteria bacterium]
MILYAGNILSKYGYTPTFIELLTPKLAESFEVKPVSEYKNQVLRMIDMIWSLLKNRNKIKLVLIDSYSMRAFWYTYILSKMSFYLKIPYVPVLRGGGYSDRLKKSSGHCRFIFSNSYKNISPSLFLKSIFEKNGYEVDYIPNFIPIENYRFKKRNSVKAKLLWVRSFDKTYNPLLAVEILYRLKSKYPDAELCMIGPDKDGTLREVIEKSRELNVNGSLILTGRLSKKEWLKLSEDYDIFINTTDFDNHPVSVIEAMALGIPVVTTNVGGIPFLITDRIDGLLVPPGDAVVFTETIEKLISDSELAGRLSENSRKKSEEFDWENIREKWISLIDPVLKN